MQCGDPNARRGLLPKIAIWKSALKGSQSCFTQGTEIYGGVFGNALGHCQYIQQLISGKRASGHTHGIIYIRLLGALLSRLDGIE